MNKTFWNVVKFGPVALAAALLTSNSAFAAEAGTTSVAQLADSNNIGQVTSVSQFSDVQPTDWAFQALQSLVERYGCIAGYPNKTFRGHRAMTRYEFAAGLNACLDRVNELIATATADLVKREDLEVVKRLQEEFGAELATLRGRVDGLEARVDELESKQFSTTAKLTGEVIFNLATPFGENQANTSSRLINSANPGAVAKPNLNSNLAFSDRVRLNISSSFTGSDRLNIRLQARNTIGNNTVTGTNQTRLSFDGGTNNSVEVDKLNYSFNATDKIRVQLDASNGEFFSNINNFNPLFSSDSRGTISRYGRFSPIYRQSAGGAGATVTFNANDSIALSAGYMARNANDPATGLTAGGVNPSPLTTDSGSSTIIGQLAFKPNSQFNVGLTYANTYQKNSFITSDGVFQGTGSNLANNPFIGTATSGTGGATRIVSNHYGVQANYSPNSTFTFGGWAGLANIKAQDGAAAGRDADAFYWMAHLGIRDFGGEGNLLGLMFGQSPKITSSRFSVAGIEQKDKDSSYHLEALYRMQMNENISITPGLLVIFNPENNSNNATQYVGTLRTTFTF